MKCSRSIRLVLLVALPGVLITSCVHKPPTPLSLAEKDWAEPASWELNSNDGSRAELAAAEGLRMAFTLGGGHGWVQLKHPLAEAPPKETPITFLFRTEATGPGLEIKFVDRDGSVFWTTLPLRGQFAAWTRVTVRGSDLGYAWGGDENLGDLAEFQLAVSGQGQGTIEFKDIGLAMSSEPSTFTRIPSQVRERGPFLVAGPLIDPDSNLPGIGFKQRRADQPTPKDPLVLEWLKTVQDVGSPGQQVLPTMPIDNQLQTFNNALVAMAFILEGEKERAERILDFYTARTDRSNTDPTLQNFFLNGEARGFFQHVELNDTPNTPAFHTKDADRWMGDMAWQLLAYTYYSRTYGPERYREITGLLRDLLVAWYTDDPAVPGGSYVQHGWRKGDQRLHEGFGHPEGNIDCYAVFKLLGDEERAARIRTWIEQVSRGNSLPLDLYTWRVLAYDGERAELLDIPDHDLRYRKTVTFNGRTGVGPYHSAAPDIENVWLDGLGHIACAYLAAGNRERGWFYGNQFDAFALDVSLDGKQLRTFPYTANSQGGFDFDQSQGVISVAAWYLFAKNGFNPMTLKIHR